MKKLLLPLVLPVLSTGLLAAASPAIVSQGFIYERAPFPQCHASTIEETTAGGLVASWFGGTREKHPDVGIWVSRQEGGRWTAPVEVANGVQYRKPDGTVHRHPTWNPVLFQPRNGPLLLFFKCGPTPETWWGMVMESADGGRTWSQPRRLPEDILGPIKNKPVQLPNGDILSPVSIETPERQSKWSVHFERTRDLGRTWERIGPVNDGVEIRAIQPSILFLGGVNARMFFLIAAVIVFAFAMMVWLSEWRRERIFAYLDPWDPKHALGKGYQLSHSLIAIGRGEIFGVGLGGSVEKLHWLPEAHTDFLLAVIGEEFGLVGVVVVISLFVWLARRCIHMKNTTTSTNGRRIGTRLVNQLGWGVL